MKLPWTKTGRKLRVMSRIRKYYNSRETAKNEQFLNVPVEIDGAEQLFNFELLNDDDGRLWIANSKLQTLYIDEEFNFDNFSMPPHWVQPAIAKLKELLGSK